MLQLCSSAFKRDSLHCSQLKELNFLFQQLSPLRPKDHRGKKHREGTHTTEEEQKELESITAFCIGKLSVVMLDIPKLT